METRETSEKSRAQFRKGNVVNENCIAKDKLEHWRRRRRRKDCVTCWRCNWTYNKKWRAQITFMPHQINDNKTGRMSLRRWNNVVAFSKCINVSLYRNYLFFRDKQRAVNQMGKKFKITNYSLFPTSFNTLRWYRHFARSVNFCHVLNKWWKFSNVFCLQYFFIFLFSSLLFNVRRCINIVSRTKRRDKVLPGI